jgi:hypothetical protein
MEAMTFNLRHLFAATAVIAIAVAQYAGTGWKGGPIDEPGAKPGSRVVWRKLRVTWGLPTRWAIYGDVAVAGIALAVYGVSRTHHRANRSTSVL